MKASNNICVISANQLNTQSLKYVTCRVHFIFDTIKAIKNAPKKLNKIEVSVENEINSSNDRFENDKRSFEEKQNDILKQEIFTNDLINKHNIILNDTI